MPGILDLDTYNRSLLFAKLSKYAYYNINSARKQAKKLGFTTIEFYDRDGAQAYRFQNKTDLVIACRGTQPTQYSDIQADLKAYPVIAETVSPVSVDETDGLVVVPNPTGVATITSGAEVYPVPP